jgi:LuxR family transcriptional regulator, maltose regulon positive regulatory protein
VLVTGPLLTTKLHVPRRRRGLVGRARLSDRLSQGDEAALILVSAPAGFGKTTVLTDWLAGVDPQQRSVAWLSIDARDDDPAVFWTYVLAALATVAPAVGAGSLQLLRSPDSSLEATLSTLINEVAAVEGDVVLVLDDYHLIESPEIHEGMAFLLEHLPPQAHLVVAGRTDPPLPLTRLRARGELVELRAADLRFTPEEAGQYLTGAMQLPLTAGQVAALDGRTEGWIAALQLAALSMQGRGDVTGFLTDFAGDDRYIVDYLVEEVLQRQPEHVRAFLLQTSILGRLTGPLCDAVTGRDDGREVLEALERGNLFVVPLDDRRQWYRYHHLFADVLQAHLLDERPGTVAGLHLRAAEWYERNGERSEAIEHALAAGAHDRAADLLELVIPGMNQHRQEATLRRWLKSLPDEVLRARPVLSAAYVGALMSTGEVRGVDARLEEVERWLAGPPGGADGVVVDDEARRRLPGQIAMFRSAQALASGDVDASMRHARRALDLAAPGDLATRGGPEALLGLACWTTGELDEGYRWYAHGMASLDDAGYTTDVVGGAVTLAEIRIAQGRLRDAMTIYRRGLRRAEQAVPALRGAADMHVGMSELFRERNDLEAARQHLERSSELGPSSDLPKNAYRRRLAMARLCEVDGDLDGAFDLLDDAERCFNNDFSPDVRPIPALRARMEAAHGRLGDALDWVGERGLTADDDLSYLREYDHVTLARVLLARHATDGDASALRAATGLLDRLLSAAEVGHRTGSVIEILVLRALAAQAGGDMPAALAALRRALSLAEPEDYVRTFVDEGPPMTALLRSAGASGSTSGYVRRLLATSGDHGDEPVAQRLVEPLSARELDVLRLLATDLDGPRIASALFVSLNTVRTHTKNIYAKLGVTNRRAAVRRGQELDLVRGR